MKQSMHVGLENVAGVLGTWRCEMTVPGGSLQS